MSAFDWKLDKTIGGCKQNAIWFALAEGARRDVSASAQAHKRKPIKNKQTTWRNRFSKNNGR